MKISVDHGEKIEIKGLAKSARAMRDGSTLDIAVLATDLLSSPSITGKKFKVLGEHWVVTTWGAEGRVFTFTCRRIADG